MNWFKAIPTIWKDKSIIEDEIKGAQQMNGNKPGWKTSTFWVKIFTVDLPVIYMSVKGFIPPDLAVKVEVLAMGIYAIYRTVDGVMKQLHDTKVAVAESSGGGDTATANVTVKAS